MRPGIMHPDYVFRPHSEESLAKMSASHRRRLGIPDGCVRIYGVYVPLDRAEPLRTFACDVARRRGFDEARRFVVRSLERNSPVELPYDVRPYRTYFGPYLPPKEYARLRILRRSIRPIAILARELAAACRRARREEARRQRYNLLEWKREQRLAYKAAKSIERFARQCFKNNYRGAVDWVLVEKLLEAHVSREEIADYFGVTLRYFQKSLYERKKDGRSQFGRGGMHVWKKRA